MVNSAISNLIRENKIYQIESVLQTGTKQGMRTLNNSLFEVVEKGIVSSDEALFRAIDRRDLRKMFDENGIEYTPEAVDDEEEE